METRNDKMLSAEERRDILGRIMEHYGISSQAEMARRVGVSAQNVSSWFSRGTYNVELIAVSFPELSGDWLLTGEEPMLKADRTGGKSETDMDLRKAIAAIAEEQRLTAKAQAQADKLLAVMHTLADAARRSQGGSE